MSILLVVTGFVLSSCTTSIVVMDDYTDIAFLDKKLTIVKLYDEPEIGIPEDVTEDLGEGKPAEVFQKYFESDLIRNFQIYSSLNRIEVGTLDSKSDLNEVNLEWSENRNFTAYLPDAESKTLFLDSDFILFLNDLQINKTSQRGAILDNYDDVLLTKLEFTFWDNMHGKLVSYGEIDESTLASGSLSKNEWNETVKKIAITLLLNSPLKKVY
ncbi:MAG: hypothetical protein K9I99_01435 [Melioribacteraceae bacterium]|nr:hypothetical protein [Melioribacteraceae bacterium]